MQVSYAEEEVAQRLVARLSNREHQTRVLSESSALSILEQKVERLQVLETTEQSAQSLHTRPPSDASAVKSQYKKGKGVPAMKEVEPKCQWCGLPSHPGGKPLEKNTCPAKDKKCNRCQKTGHFGRVCRTSEAAAADSDEASDELQRIPSDSAVSFSFGTEQDFRVANKSRGEP